MLLNIINESWKQALRNKDVLRKDTLTMLRSAIKNVEIENRGPIDDVAIVAVINKEVKKRLDASLAYDKGNRPEQARLELDEAVILKEYLPLPVSNEEMKSLVDAVILSTGADSLKDMGRVMKEASTQLAGRADNRAVSLYLREKLS